METDNNRVMTVKDLAGYLRVHPTTVYRQLKFGLSPAFMGVSTSNRSPLVPRSRQCLHEENSSWHLRSEKVRVGSLGA
jgi:hypothetical protein